MTTEDELYQHLLYLKKKYRGLKYASNGLYAFCFLLFMSVMFDSTKSLALLFYDLLGPLAPFVFLWLGGNLRAYYVTVTDWRPVRGGMPFFMKIVVLWFNILFFAWIFGLIG